MSNQQVGVEFVGSSAGAVTAARSTAAAIGTVRSEANMLSPSMRTAEQDIGKASRGALAGSGMFRGLGRSVAFASAGFLGGYGLIAAMRGAADELVTQVKLNAQAKAEIRSTGGVAGVTAKMMDSLAAAEMRKTGADKQQIKAAEIMLLRYTNVRDVVGEGNDIFGRATKSALDLASATGTDVTDAATLLGKALQDPIKGASSLSRAHVALTAAEVAHIKKLGEEGKVLEAQKALLDAVAKSYGGTAEAVSNVAPWTRLSSTLKEMAASAIKPLLPDIDSLVGRIQHWADGLAKNRAEQQRLKHDVEEGAHAIGDLAKGVSKVAGVMGGWGNLIKGLVALKVATTLMRWTGALGGFSGALGRGAAAGVAGEGGAVGRSGALLANMRSLARIGTLSIGVDLLFSSKGQGAKGLIGALLTGAAIGSSFGPWGALLGGAAALTIDVFVQQGHKGGSFDGLKGDQGPGPANQTRASQVAQVPGGEVYVDANGNWEFRKNTGKDGYGVKYEQITRHQAEELLAERDKAGQRRLYYAEHPKMLSYAEWKRQVDNAHALYPNRPLDDSRAVYKALATGGDYGTEKGFEKVWSAYLQKRVAKMEQSVTHSGTGVNAARGDTFERIDQGVDVSGKAVRAIASGVIVSVSGGMAGGTGKIIKQRFDNPVTVRGRTYYGAYYSEGKPVVQRGDHATAGDVVMTGPSFEIGFLLGKSLTFPPLRGGLGKNTKPDQSGSDLDALIRAHGGYGHGSGSATSGASSPDTSPVTSGKTSVKMITGSSLIPIGLRGKIGHAADMALKTRGLVAAGWLHTEIQDLQDARSELERRLKAASGKQRQAIQTEIQTVDAAIARTQKSVASGLTTWIHAQLATIEKQADTAFNAQTAAHIQNVLAPQFFQGTDAHGNQRLTPAEAELQAMQAQDTVTSLADQLTQAQKQLAADQAAGADTATIANDQTAVDQAQRQIKENDLAIEATKERAQADADYAAAVRKYTAERTKKLADLNTGLGKFVTALGQGTAALGDLAGVLKRFGLPAHSVHANGHHHHGGKVVTVGGDSGGGSGPTYVSPSVVPSFSTGESAVGQQVADALEQILVTSGGTPVLVAGDVIMDGYKVGKTVARPVADATRRQISYTLQRG